MSQINDHFDQRSILTLKSRKIEKYDKVPLVHQFILLMYQYLLAVSYHANVSNGIFVRTGPNACTRSRFVMNTESMFDIEWSIKLVGADFFYAGIASQLRMESANIKDYDEHAILYQSYDTDVVKKGSHTIYDNLIDQKDGDIINFKFRPNSKKLIIELVRKRFFS